MASTTSAFTLSQSPVLNLRDTAFMLHEVLDTRTLLSRDAFAHLTVEDVDAALEAAVKMAEDLFAPHRVLGDEQEPRFDGEAVHIIPEVKAALDAFAEAGFVSRGFPLDDGGMGLPCTVNSALFQPFNAANVATASYPMLTTAAANLLRVYGTEEQKAKYLEPMLDGRFFGTMNLSEPHAGSSLGDITTRATPVLKDGSTEASHYLMKGNKMWISGGEHSLSDNIVHLVLAKLPDAPPGVKGISLFLVPKIRVNDDGSLGQHNDVHLGGLNHKMGWRGTVNTYLSYGDNGDCHGYLVGKPHQGLSAMFHMMNEARVGVGMSAADIAYAGYHKSLTYACERTQGRDVAAKDPTQPQIPIVNHADVRRMLLTQKANIEGAKMLCLMAARLVDEANTADSAEARKQASTLLDVLTPVVKAWPSEWCLEANKWAIQVFGGYGFARDSGVEQLYRDNRLNMIHEGTNGIQALDLLGRKVMMHKGEGLRLLAAAALEDVAAARACGSEHVTSMAADLEEALGMVGRVTATLGAAGARGDVDVMLSNAHEYLNMFGDTVIAWMWLKQAVAASAALDACADGSDAVADTDAAFYRGKIAAATYFYRVQLPHAHVRGRLLESLDTTVCDVNPAWL